MQPEIIESIRNAYSFLANEPGFTSRTEGDLLVFQSEGLVVESSFDERDGLDTRIRLPLIEEAALSVRTIVSALSHNARDYASSSISECLRIDAGFVKENMPKIISMPVDIYGDCRALQFWHAYKWRGSWGKEIVMDEQSIQAEKARLGRIERYFGSKPLSADAQPFAAGRRP